jgi:protein AFG1
VLVDYHPPKLVHRDPKLLQPPLKSVFSSLFSSKRGRNSISDILANLPKGLYMYGDVGSGKTMLMDLFFDTLPPNITSKARIHFHNFMQDVHKRLHKIMMVYGNDFNAVPLVAADIAETAQLLCLDEFQCTDVADAMILRRLIESLMSYSVIIIITSNRYPDDLYKNGIQRESFIPCINLLKSRLRVINLDSTTDYRKLLGPPSGVYHHPLDKAARRHADGWFRFLGDPERDPPHPATVTVWGREVHVPQASGKAARFTFEELIGRATGAADYLELIRWYDAFIVTDIPAMTFRERDWARRFITFIDAVYESRAKLVLTTAVPLSQLFISKQELDESIKSVKEKVSDNGKEAQQEDKKVAEVALGEHDDVDDVMRILMDDLGMTMSMLKQSSLFSGDEERFAFARALSRLSEMGSQEWVERGRGMGSQEWVERGLGMEHNRFRDDEQPATKIISMTDPGKGKVSAIPEELVDFRMALRDTTVGRLFSHELESMAQKHERQIEDLRRQMESAMRERDQSMASELERIREEMQAQIRADRKEQTRLEVAWDHQLREHYLEDQATTTGNKEAFVYPELRPGQIRLVRLHAGEGSTPVEVSLVVSDLKESLKYEALSYVVGAADFSASVNLTVGSRIMKLPVSRVLETVLRQLRRSRWDRLMWIDAISINQTDLEERSREVRRMSQVFALAQNVCIWLGPQADNSDVAMEFIPQIIELSVADEYVKDASKREQWLALAQLMGREWFSRRWCVQEMALARRATVHCGDKIVIWPDFADAAAVFGTKWPEIVQLLDPKKAYEFGEVQIPGATSLVNISSRLFRGHKKGSNKGRLHNIETLLAMLPMFDVTNALDAVYAIIDLGSDTYGTSEIPIDYRLEPAVLFQAVLKAVINTSGSLDIICRPWAPICIVPSWISTVANYAFVRRPDGQYDRQNGDNLVGSSGRRIYNAAGNTLTHENVHFSSEENVPILTANGFTIGIVEAVGDRCINGSIPANWMSLGAWSKRSQAVPPDFWRTLVADRDPHRDYPPRWYAKACEQSFRKSSTLDVDIPKLIVNCDSTGEQEFLRRVRSTTWNRTFFTMKSSDGVNSPDFSGLGPAHVREKDNICILFGCSVPVVLRRKGAAFELIGECFVCNMMEGEAMRGYKHGKYEKQSFDIQ